MAPEDQIAKLQEELQAARDRELRARAELDNYRKRAAREIAEQLRYAQLPLIRDVLPVLDNVKRAVDAARKTHDAAGLLEGIELVARQLQGALERHHCTPIQALHAPFDPNLHEAVLQQPSEQFPPNTVLEEVRAGYRLHDRVVRPSQVIVSTAADTSPGKGDNQGGTEAEKKNEGSGIRNEG
ncbi:MAG: nucleotide exchange factor GrpE [Thermoguttaceae bacterium]